MADKIREVPLKLSTICCRKRLMKFGQFPLKIISRLKTECKDTTIF